MTPRRPNELKTDLQWGLKWGIYYAGFYTVAGSLILAVRGFGEEGMEWLLVAAGFYWVSGGAVGLIVGLLRPMTKTFLGNTIVAIVAGIPVAFAAYSLIIPIQEWRQLLVPFSLISALIAGIVYSAALWSPPDS